MSGRARLSAHATSASTLLYAAFSLVGAVALAAAALFLPVRRRGHNQGAVERAGTRTVARLRTLHSGHVGDYVAWLVPEPPPSGLRSR